MAKRGGECPCHGCAHEPPEVWEENRTAWTLYARFGNQVRPGCGGIYGFDLPAIVSLGERCGHVVDDDCMQKLAHIEGLVLRQQNKDLKNLRGKQPRKHR